MAALTESELAKVGREILFEKIVADYCLALELCFPPPTGIEPPEQGMHLSIVAARKDMAKNLAPRLVQIGKLPESVLEDLKNDWEKVESQVHHVLNPEYLSFQREKKAYLKSQGRVL